jgi:hypothetical protein
MKVVRSFFLFNFGGKNFDSGDFSGENLKLLLPPIQPDLRTYINFFFLLKPERFSAKKMGGTQKRCFRQRRRRRRNKRGGPKPRK